MTWFDVQHAAFFVALVAAASRWWGPNIFNLSDETLHTVSAVATLVFIVIGVVLW